jgi:hypothetical protein
LKRCVCKGWQAFNRLSCKVNLDLFGVVCHTAINPIEIGGRPGYPKFVRKSTKYSVPKFDLEKAK